MSATILHNGQRKKIKFNSQTSTIQSLVEEAALAYELDPLQCDLVHNRKILDKGQLFRFSGVSNNATLELQVTNKSKSLKEVKIALTAEDLGSRTDVFSPSQTLRDVLQKFVEDDFLPRDVLLKSPIIVYLRQQFAGDQLETTLHSLGLDSAGGRLQLRFDKNAVVTSNEDSTKESGYVNKQSSSDDMKEISPQPVVEGVEPARVKQPSVTSPSLESSPQIPPSSQPAINTFLNSLPIQIPSVEVTLQRCQDMLNTNFDCVSSLAMTTITKYLDNLIKHPHDLKYRTINTQNPIFAENILPAKGAVEILFALGFLPQLPEYLMISDPRQNVQSSTTKLFFQYEAISETSDGLITVALLKSIRVNVCEVIMNELNIPIEKRPPVPVPPSERPQAETPQLIPFDPFKPLIIRTSVQV